MKTTCRRVSSVLLLGLALFAAACGSAGGATSSADPAIASSAGDKATEAAIRKNAAFVCPTAAAQTGTERGALPNGRKLVVASTVAPITSIVANIAGDKADVRGVIPEGEDSHTYDPKPSVAELFTKADVVIVNGLDLEDPTKDLAKRNLAANGQVIELGSVVLAPDAYIYDFSFPRDAGKPNPHLWTNPPMAACFATIVASVLSKADPANAPTYGTNAAALIAKINDLGGRFRRASEKMPTNTRKLLTYHDAYAYFAAYYGWTVLGAVQVTNFEEPKPKEVAALIAQVKREKIPAIFGSEVFPSAVLAQIGKEAKVTYVDTLRDDDLPGQPGDVDHSYLGLMKADFVTIVSSLGGDASELKAFDAADVTTDQAEYPQ
jgi:ABC-type Zn uptake system ZnuABC Zn-binding protein ZnuA